MRIPLEVLGYSESSGWGQGYRGQHVLFQTFQRKVTNDVLQQELRTAMCFNGANRDGEFLLWARERLLQQKAQRHIMLIISDGQPRSGQAGDVAGFTKDVIDRITKEGLIDLYAIGLVNKSVRTFYPHSCMIDSAAELEEKLLNVLKDKIIDHISQ